jgi:hypothetical protein
LSRCTPTAATAVDAGIVRTASAAAAAVTAAATSTNPNRRAAVVSAASTISDASESGVSTFSTVTYSTAADVSATVSSASSAVNSAAAAAAAAAAASTAVAATADVVTAATAIAVPAATSAIIALAAAFECVKFAPDNFIQRAQEICKPFAKIQSDAFAQHNTVRFHQYSSDSILYSGIYLSLPPSNHRILQASGVSSNQRGPID